MKLKCYIKDANIAKNICGIQNKNIEIIEDMFNCILDIHGDSVLTNVDNENDANILEQFMSALIEFAELGIHITLRDIVYIKKMQELGDLEKYMKYVRVRKPIAYNQNNKPVYAKTFNQAEYLKLLNEKDLIFSTGSAGSGKTYLAVAAAVAAFRERTVNRIILTRPAVEAGEKLGFLPGDMRDKIDPYLQPLYDALEDMIPMSKLKEFKQKAHINNKADILLSALYVLIFLHNFKISW